MKRLNLWNAECGRAVEAAFVRIEMQIALWCVKEQGKRFTARRQFSYRSGPDIGDVVCVLWFLM